MCETNEQVRQGIIQAASRPGSDSGKQFWVGKRTAKGYEGADRAQQSDALAHAYSLAVVPKYDESAVEQGRDCVYVYDRELDQICGLRKIT
jgi:hypothetical protein